MDKSVAVLAGMVVAGLVAAAAFAAYRWWQRERVRRVEGWVEDYLSARYGMLPDSLSIDCSDDPLWPVLVNFVAPETGVRHRLQFMCPGPHLSFALIAEKEDRRQPGA